MRPSVKPPALAIKKETKELLSGKTKEKNSKYCVPYVQKGRRCGYTHFYTKNISKRSYKLVTEVLSEKGHQGLPKREL